MPRFAILLKATAASEAGILPSRKAMLAYNESLVKAGVKVSGEALQASSKSTRVIFNDSITVLPGPFTPVEDLVFGFWIFKTETQEEAVEWVKKCPGLEKGTIIEVRKILEHDDFGEVLTPELKTS